MDINSLQGTTAYTNTPGTTRRIDNAELREQNVKAAKTDLKTEDANAAQKAFEVSITEKARERQASEEAKEAREAKAEAEMQNNRNTEQAHETSQIVNIVA